MSRLLVALALAATASTAGAPAARAYDFEIRARTYGQAEELRSLRFVGGSLLLSVRRFTQTLALSIWDIGRASRIWRQYDTTRRRGPRFSFHSYLRLDHDFGDYTSGTVDIGDRRLSAVDAIPELEAGALQLDVLYAFAAAEDLADGRLDLYLGRQIGTDALDWYAFDGARARAESQRIPLAVEAFGGLQVRESSPVGWAELEPDGTSGAECQEYVEGAAAGTGAWRPIDLGFREDESLFRSDLERCPQREEPMPTFGGALELTDVPHVRARVGYRRAISQTPGLLGERDRLEFDDTGLYPDENGQAPDWGVNQERLTLSLRSPWELARGKGGVVGVASLRYSLLHGLVDDALLGAEGRWGADTLSPELTYSFPTFDGDSIFNVFSIEPNTGARLTWEHAPPTAAWRTSLRGWVRRYHDAADGALAAGGQGGAAWVPARDRSARLDLVHEDGHGGRRTGGWGTVRWRVARKLVLGSRLGLIDYDTETEDTPDGWSIGLQGGGTYQLHDEIALSVVAEDNANPVYANQVSLFAVLDMAFRPEI
ncbi:MAG TPA: hypothetical protein VMZ28_09990 [Kofleriaceae bacterium]|nr:hypothetical protein [Kofleriaceae bacterium]